MTRREFMIASAALGAAATLPIEALSARRRSLRLAHLTDTHIRPDVGYSFATHSQEWLPKVYEHAQRKHGPDLIVMGGDCVMDSFATDFDRTRAQWQLFNAVVRQNVGAKIDYCMGNHDVWGWNKEKSKAIGNEPTYGKNWFLETLRLPKTYRSFDFRGWHFVILDSITQNGGGYIGKLDDEQFDWLGKDLAATKLPTCVVSHIPILAVCPILFSDFTKDGQNWRVPGALLHIDGRKISALFYKHKHVKLALSGHIHLLDRVDYNGMTYLCNGAVCGSWWGGNHHETPPGYAVLDLFDDGTFSHQYVTYGWKKA